MADDEEEDDGMTPFPTEGRRARPRSRARGIAATLATLLAALFWGPHVAESLAGRGEMSLGGAYVELPGAGACDESDASAPR